jgi:hypothetical protein
MIGKCYLQLTLLTILIFLGAPANAAVVKTDFNGDAKADLFLQNIFTGDLSAWLTDGNQVLQKISYGTVAPGTGWTLIGIKDVSGDQRSDLIWHNTKTGEISAWLINGSSVQQIVAYGSVARNSGWMPTGLHDFNADGRADLLWYNAYSGAVSAWLLNGNNPPQMVTFGTLSPESGWLPIGAKDVNGDGTADLFWYNIHAGGVSAWLIGDNKVLQSVSYGTIAPSTGWIPISIENFNTDVRADLLWYNRYTGEVSAWLLGGNAIIQITSYGTNPANNGWVPVDVKDISGDGNADLLWYNKNTGGMSAWLISGSAVTQSVSLGALSPDEGWSPAGLDDFNGDGRIDLLWYNAFTSATETWLLSGSGILQTVSYGALPLSSVWQVKIPGG